MISNFAEKIFKSVVSSEVVVEAKKKYFDHHNCWGVPETNLYKNLNSWLDSYNCDLQDLKKVLKEAKVPKHIIESVFDEEISYIN